MITAAVTNTFISH